MANSVLAPPTLETLACGGLVANVIGDVNIRCIELHEVSQDAEVSQLCYWNVVAKKRSRCLGNPQPGNVASSMDIGEYRLENEKNILVKAYR